MFSKFFKKSLFFVIIVCLFGSIISFDFVNASSSLGNYVGENVKSSTPKAESSKGAMQSSSERMRMVSRKSYYVEDYVTPGQGKAGLTRMVTNIIKIALGFLGTIFLIMTIYAGFIWATAGGNDEKITKARKMLYNGMIGVLIVVSAYAITSFVGSSVQKATVEYEYDAPGTRL